MTYDAPAASVPKPVVDKPSTPITVIEKAVTDATKPGTQTTTGTQGTAQVPGQSSNLLQGLIPCPNVKWPARHPQLLRSLKLLC